MSEFTDVSYVNTRTTEKTVSIVLFVVILVAALVAMCKNYRKEELGSIKSMRHIRKRRCTRRERLVNEEVEQSDRNESSSNSDNELEEVVHTTDQQDFQIEVTQHQQTTTSTGYENENLHVVMVHNSEVKTKEETLRNPKQNPWGSLAAEIKSKKLQKGKNNGTQKKVHNPLDIKDNFKLELNKALERRRAMLKSFEVIELETLDKDRQYH